MSLIVDSHEDLAWNILSFGRDYTRSAYETRRLEQGGAAVIHNDDTLLGWPEYQQAQVAVIFSTLFSTPARWAYEWETLVYRTPQEAHAQYRRQLDVYQRLTGDHPDKFHLLTTKAGGTGELGVRQVLALTAMAVGTLLALDVLDLSSLVSAMLGAAGVFGLAVGFGLRDIVENYLAGVLLSLRSPFTIGDWISVSGAEGSVVRLTSRELVLMTIEGNHTRVPNASVFKSIIVNFSRNPLRRFSVSYSPAPGADAEAMRKAGLAVLREMRGVLDDPAPFVQTGGTWPGLLIIFIGWMDQRQDDFIAVQSEAARLVNLALERVDRGEEVGQALLESARNAATGRSGELDRQIALDLATGEASFLPPDAKDSQAKDIS